METQKKKNKNKSLAAMGHAKTVKTGLSHGTMVNDWLKQTGVLDEIEQFKPEDTGNFTQDLINRGKWLKEKQGMIDKMLEIYVSVGGTAANYMTQIKKLQYDLLMLEKELEERGENPLLDPMYHKNLKLLQEMILNANKLNLDISKARADYQFKKQGKGDLDAEFTVIDDSSDL